jgi:hypothetical protein
LPAHPTTVQPLPAVKANPAFRFMPSLTDMAFLMPVLFLFGRMDGAQALLADGDTGWHIRTGEWILRNHTIPSRDIFSFTKAGEPWYAWEWLCDVVFGWLNQHGGLAAVLVLSVLLISTTYAFLFRLANRKANPIVAVAITMIAAAASAIHWLARPHLFTLLMLVLFCCVVEAVRDGRERYRGIPLLAILPLATIVWTNLHGGFFMGIVLLAAYGTGELLNLLLAPIRNPAARRRARNYFLSAAGCSAASFVNPYFYRLHVHAFRFLTDSFQAQHIDEYLTLNFHHPVAIFFELLLVLATGAAIWHAARGRCTEAVLFLIFGHAALLAARNIPLFAIVATPFIATAIDAWLRALAKLNVAGWLRMASERFAVVMDEVAATDAIPRWHLVSMVGIALVVALLYAPAPPRRFRPEYDPQSYPAGAVAFLKNDPSARIFAIDDWGDYLIYRLYPKTRSFIDGRFDFYGDRFLQTYFDVMAVKYNWQSTLDHYGVNTVLLPPSAALSGVLKESRRWRVVYDDGVAVVFQPAKDELGARNVARPLSAHLRRCDP